LEGRITMNIEPSDGPLLWLRGERVALGPFSRDLIHDYWRWEQDPQVVIGYGRQTPESREARVAGYDAQARNTQGQARFTVYDLTTGSSPRPVGTTALLIDHQVRTAEYVILLGPEGRGRGLAGEASLLTLDYALPHHQPAGGVAEGSGAQHRRSAGVRECRVQAGRAAT
jgi:diamine N-acetyltransferase